MGSIAAGARVTLQMELTLPDTPSPGPDTLCWALLDGRLSVTSPTSTPIEIEAG